MQGHQILSTLLDDCMRRVRRRRLRRRRLTSCGRHDLSARGAAFGYGKQGSTSLGLQALVWMRPDRRHDDRRRPCLRCRFRTGRGTSRDMTQHIQPKPLHDQLARVSPKGRNNDRHASRVHDGLSIGRACFRYIAQHAVGSRQQDYIALVDPQGRNGRRYAALVHNLLGADCAALHDPTQSRCPNILNVNILRMCPHRCYQYRYASCVRD
mmetsp:Transcript_36103/g.86593  ORF Transcript_36103/g.86593 Transcript_36103/m.86593 type:complete len:210 (-) Transcript_36103:953-1582(-)